MQLYAFERNCDGAAIDALYSPDDVPRIGDEVLIDGKLCTRVASFLLDGAGIARKTHGYPLHSESLPRDVDLGCPRDSKGRQIIKSARQEKSVLDAASGYSQSIGEGNWERD